MEGLLGAGERVCGAWGERWLGLFNFGHRQAFTQTLPCLKDSISLGKNTSKCIQIIQFFHSFIQVYYTKYT